jgi:hypothetical protein
LAVKVADAELGGAFANGSWLSRFGSWRDWLIQPSSLLLPNRFPEAQLAETERNLLSQPARHISGDCEVSGCEWCPATELLDGLWKQIEQFLGGSDHTPVFDAHETAILNREVSLTEPSLRARNPKLFFGDQQQFQRQSRMWERSEEVDQFAEDIRKILSARTPTT